MKETNYKLKVVFLRPELGAQGTKDVTSEYLAKKHGFDLVEAEIESLPDSLDRGTTVFHRMTPRPGAEPAPALRLHQIKGHLKAAAQFQNGKVTGDIKALKSKVNNAVFISPDFIELHIPQDGQLEYYERPLRADTAQGPRVALARSEMLPAGTWFECGITVLNDVISETVLRELLDYGYYMGLGQFRNGGFGQFRYELEREE